MATAWSQAECKVKCDVQNEPLTKFFRILEEQCDARFAYDSYVVRDVLVSLNCDELSLKEVLDKVLIPQKLTYKYISGTYAVLPIRPDVPTDPVPEISVGEKSLTLVGTVRSANTLELLPYASIQVKNESIGTFTDADGEFLLQFESSLTDSLLISYIGYETLLLSASIFKSGSRNEILLQERKNFMPSVLIEAERVRLADTRNTTSQLLINPNDIVTRHGMGESDVMRAAQLTPGISATQENSGGLYIRGSGNDQTLVSLDGFTLYHLDHFFGAFSALNANAVKTIRIMKGAMDAEYGGRVGGLVEVIGREGSNSKPSALINLGSLSISGSVEAPMGANKNSSILITGRRAFTDLVYSPTYKGIFNRTYSSAVVTNLDDGEVETFGTSSEPDYFFQDINAKLTLRPDDKDVVSISAYGGKDQLFVTYADTSDNQTENLQDVIYTDESTWKNIGAGGRWGHRFSDLAESNLQIGWSRFQTDFFSRDTIRSLVALEDNTPFKTEQTSLTDFNAKGTFIQTVHEHRLLTGFQVNWIGTALSIGNNALAQEEQNQRAAIISLFVQDNWRCTKRWTAKPGLRINNYSQNEQWYTEYRLNLLRRSDSGKWNVKLAAGRVHQFIQRIRTQSLYLNTPDYWKLAGDENVPVLISDQIIAGIAYAHKRITMDVESYIKLNQGNTTYLGNYNGYRDAYPTDSINARGQINGHGKAMGADLLVQYDAGRHHVGFSYSLLSAFTDYKSLEHHRVPELYDQRHELKAHYQFETKRWETGLFYVYGSGRPFTPLLGTYTMSLPNEEHRKIPVYGNINSARLPAYHRLDIAVSYRFIVGDAQGSITLSCFNLYNRSNVRDIQYVALRNGNEQEDYTIAERKVLMFGLLPSLSIIIHFKG